MISKDRKFPQVSVIIPTRPAGQVEAAIAALRQLDYPQKLMEVFVSYGFSPSKQRNEAVKKAKGEILYFIDNDVQVEKETLKRIINLFNGEFVSVHVPQARGFSFLPLWISNLVIKKFFSGMIYKGETVVVGGPNVWWRSEPFWASMVGVVLESFFAHFLVAARYRPLGLVHRATEKELILCNLAIKRKVFVEVGGFREILYPNEENELLNRIEKKGYQLLYHPGALVSRPHRESVGAVLTAFFHYGRGRMEQMRLEGVSPSLIFLVPLVFAGYLLLLTLFHPLWFLTPLAFYFLAAFASAFGFTARRKKVYLSFILPFIFLSVHLAYACGLLLGNLTDLEKRTKTRRKDQVEVVRIKALNRFW